MAVRRISAEDGEKFLNLLFKLDNETKFMLFEPGERVITKEQLEKGIAESNDNIGTILVAEIQGEIVGFLRAERGLCNRIKHRASIAIGVLEEYSGKGIGKQLFKELDNWAIDEGVTRLELTVMCHNTRAIKLYEKMGYYVEGMKKNSIKIDSQYINEYYMTKLFNIK